MLTITFLNVTKKDDATEAAVDIAFDDIAVDGITFHTWPKPNDGIVLVTGYEFGLPAGVRFSPVAEEELAEDLLYVLQSLEPEPGEVFSRERVRARPERVPVAA